MPDDQVLAIMAAILYATPEFQTQEGAAATAVELLDAVRAQQKERLRALGPSWKCVTCGWANEPEAEACDYCGIQRYAPPGMP